MTVFTLSSGNLYLYYPTNEYYIGFGIFKTPDNVFLGGVLDREAFRKFKTFIQLGCKPMTFDADYDKALDNLDFVPFMEKLREPMRSTFSLSIPHWISDDSHGGLHNASNACGSRFNYYDASGLSSIKDSHKRFSLAIFLANHISVYSVSKSLHIYMNGVSHLSKSKHVNTGFLAPAPYVRMLLSNM